MKKPSSAFTLIELLVVIAIISLLASIIFFSLSAAKAKAQDAKKISEAGQVQTALELYYEKNNTMPPDYNCTNSTGCTPVSPAQGTLETEGTPAYTASMNQLVSQGDLTAIPTSPDHTYAYYNYGTGTPQGAVFSTTLQVTNPATEMQPTCQIQGTSPADLYGLTQTLKNYFGINYTGTNISGYCQYESGLNTCIPEGPSCSNYNFQGYICEVYQGSTPYCTWYTDTFFTKIESTPQGSDCAPVVAASQCSGNNFCVCNKY